MLVWVVSGTGDVPRNYEKAIETSENYAHMFIDVALTVVNLFSFFVITRNPAGRFGPKFDTTKNFLSSTSWTSFRTKSLQGNQKA